MKRRSIISVCVAAIAALGFGLLAAGPADAVVGTTPATWTPQLASANSQIRQLVQCGSTMYAVGQFTSISQGGTTYARANAFSFSATTGAVTSWNPSPNELVDSIALSPDCSTAYLGGKFTSISGITVRDIAAVSTSTGAVTTAFGHNASAEVDTVVVVDGGNELMVGGSFTSINGTSKAYLVSMSPSTGKVDNYFSTAVAGQLPGSGASKVYNQQVSSQGDRLLFEGNFTTIGGVGHLQAAELDLSSTGATLDPWANSTLDSTYCGDSEEFYARAGGFSPDEQTIYLATTGYAGSSPFCDAVTAFSNTASAPVKWINQTGGDSLYSVAAGPNDVYIGGHERWADNPSGQNSCGTGCVSRPGLGDIGASTGTATSWNPTRDRGLGADDLLITSAGLWVASDNVYSSYKCGGVDHAGICFLPGTA